MTNDVRATSITKSNRPEFETIIWPQRGEKVADVRVSVFRKRSRSMEIGASSNFVFVIRVNDSDVFDM